MTDIYIDGSYSFHFVLVVNIPLELTQPLPFIIYTLGALKNTFDFEFDGKMPAMNFVLFSQGKKIKKL